MHGGKEKGRFRRDSSGLAIFGGSLQLTVVEARRDPSKEEPSEAGFRSSSAYSARSRAGLCTFRKERLEESNGRN